MNEKLYWILITCTVTTISFYFFGISGYNYFFSDVYVYLSYAESLHNIGYIRDLTTNPSSAPVTTQNGIVLIFTLLDNLTDNMMMKMQIVSFLLTINLIVCYLLIYKIGLLLDISKNVLYVLIIGLVFSFYFYAYYIAPMNDGFYISLFLLSLYLFLKLSIENNKIYWALLFIISVVVPMFRLQGLVVYIAAFLTILIIQKKYKNSIFIFFYIILGFISVKIFMNLLINDTSGLEELSKLSIIYHWDTLQDSLIGVLNNAIPSMFLNFPALRINSEIFFYIKIIFSSVIIILLLIVLFKSFKNRNSMIFMITMIIFGNFAALILLNVILDRYIYINAVLIILVFLFYMKKEYQMYIAISFLIFSLFTFSLRLYYKQYDSSNITKNINYIKDNYKSYNLISEFPRKTYFYLNKASIEDIQYIDSKTNIILIIGTKEYIRHKLDKINKIFNIVKKDYIKLYWINGYEEYYTLKVEIRSTL